MKWRVSGKQHISKNCLVCGVENPFGLKTKFYELENKEVVAFFTPHTYLQSYPGILHGGISATILDETIGRAIMAHYGQANFGVTIELNVKYKKPVPLDVELKVIGRITNDKGRIFEGTGELILPNGEVAITAQGRYMKREVSQIVENAFIESEWFESDGEDKDEIEL
jgi:uncharacterized protein (TIGR00369 family)